jgi:hypothetical protein
MTDFLTTISLRNMGFALILISLTFSWVLVLYRYILRVDETKVNTEYILKGHIDYLLMAFLLMILSFLGGKPNPFLILFTCIGTLANPTMFIILAFKPGLTKSPKSLFGMVSTISYIFTTVGVGGICIYHLMMQ